MEEKPDMDFSPVDMELSASDLSIYDKLSETIDLGLVTLGLVLLTAYFMIQPHTLSVPETTLSRAHAWGSLMNHIRLLSLPITKKYMLEKCQDWLGLGCRQNMSLPANCSCCCSMKNLVAVADLGQLSEKLLQPQLLLIKTGQYRSYAEMKHFQHLYPELTDFVVREDSSEIWSNYPRQRLAFQMFKQNPLNKTQILQEIFPIFSSLLYPKAVSLENCFLIHHPRFQDKASTSIFIEILEQYFHQHSKEFISSRQLASSKDEHPPSGFLREVIVGVEVDWTYRLQSVFVVGSGQLTLNVIPSSLCRDHCEALVVELEAGDIGFANVDYWTTSFNCKGSEPTVVCDGSAS
ncbi:hypothetical protein JD844_018252 [Phrynosoma platyrhinos]|uniref:Uncharacterized protein n=1 Tax=Phrynosoma platyrhinos TaxID=52577 RepID=A0ABQ7SN52_PHRPL|nr:hypothetical protein JD844_018252 [Phrynosoma platyrhinos]